MGIEIANTSLEVGIIMLLILCGFALSGLILAILFYRKEPLSSQFYKVSWYIQTIGQTLAIVIVFIGFLGPWGFIFQEYINTGPCLLKHVDAIIFPMGISNPNKGIVYYYGIENKTSLYYLNNETKNISGNIFTNKNCTNPIQENFNYSVLTCEVGNSVPKSFLEFQASFFKR